jgi:hypothetical protein
MVRRAIFALLVACGPDPASVVYLRNDHCPVDGCGMDAGTIDAGPVVIPQDPLENWDTTGEGPLSGIFAVETTIQARVAVKVELKQLYRLRIVQKGTDLHEKTTLCSFKLPSVPGTATLIIPPTLQDLLNSKATENEGNYLSSDAVLNATWTPPQFLVTAGVKLQNPATDLLPTDPLSPEVIDEDNDGHPGVTLKADVLSCSSEQLLYVAMRITGSLLGTVITPDLMTGKLTAHLDESILDYSDPCLSAARQLHIEIYPGSPFRAQKTTSAQDLNHDGNVSCPEINLTASQIFSDWTP